MEASGKENNNYQELLADLVNKLKNSLIRLNFSDADISIVMQAFEMADKAHKGQIRKSGEPYITHPVSVAIILAEMDCDTETICAGLLHDVIEDTLIGAEEIEKKFGPDLVRLVEGVTKLNKLSFASKREAQAENFRKMFLAIASELRVVLVKLADRLHNMRTLDYMSPQKQKEISIETLEIFAPLANRFGLGHVKWQLEDLSFRYLNPIEYRRIEKMVNENRTHRELYLEELISVLKDELRKNNIKADISGRAKHFYSIHQKVERLQTEEIFDLLAVRVVVDKVNQCYEVLGIVHDMFNPIPGRFKDYIAIPKSNMYQSLHTSVIGPKQKLVEIQIRTLDMHRIAEYGVAAHWKYKENGQSAKSSSTYDNQLSQLRQKLMDIQAELPDAGDYSKAVQIDIFADEIFVLSPKGDVYRLPRDSTPVDFAYYVHSEIGNKCIGAKVNERIVTLNHKLKNGDIVEIQTSKNSHPSADWLSFVQSSTVKSKIKSWFKKNKRSEFVEMGKSMLSENLGRSLFEELIKNFGLKTVSSKMGLNSEEELFLRLASSDISINQIIGRLNNEGLINKEETQTSNTIEDYINRLKTKKVSSVGEIQSLKNLMHSFGKCCQPVPGENIIGVISRGRGVVIHREDCPNLNEVDTRRLVPVAWGENDKAGKAFATTLEVECIDRIGISRDILDKMANAKINILDVRVITRPTRQTALVRVSIEVPNIEVLDKLIDSLRRLSDVMGIKRYVLRSSGRSAK